VTPRELLRELVSTPSVSGGEQAAAGVLVDYFEDAGRDAWLDGAGNVRAPGDDGVLLTSHLDTVPGHIDVREERAASAPPQGDGETVGRELWGRGSVDATGPLAAMAAASVATGASFIVGAAMAGYEVRAATPRGYGFDGDVLARAREHGGVTVGSDPEAATAHADAAYTDVWVSMGEEAERADEHSESAERRAGSNATRERADRLAAFEGFQVDQALLGESLFMHCLPAHRDEEVTAAVVGGPQSVAWQQAENRLHAQKALLVSLLA
jgi:ornithine carbamoyltransferase